MPANRDLLQSVVVAMYPGAGKITHLGTGGFASTFCVEENGERFAVKICDPSLQEERRIDRELTALKQIDHPNVVKYKDFQRFEYEGVTFGAISMEYVDGPSLSSELRDKGIRFDIPIAIQLLRSAVSGASAIWLAKTAHRDLSPNNLLIRNDGLVIVDLGMARHLDDETITSLPTPGTPGWMSPEQVGPDPSHGDWRSDQFVLGLVGYYLLTGQTPFTVSNLQDCWRAPLMQKIKPVREANPEVPVVVAEVIDRMLQKKPHRRFPTGKHLIEDLDRALAAVSAVGVISESEAVPRFYVAIGSTKRYLSEEILRHEAVGGVVVDGRYPNCLQEIHAKAERYSVPIAVDPVTYLGRSPLEVRPSYYKNLPYGNIEALAGYLENSRDEFLRSVVGASGRDVRDILVAPYFFAGSGEMNWVDYSLDCAQALASQSLEDEQGPEIWTGIALHSEWLSELDLRDRLLARLTEQPPETLYLLVATTQPSFGPLADEQVLGGFVDFLSVMSEVGSKVICARRSTCGLLLIALGAAGWSIGVESTMQNMVPHPLEVEPGGGRAYDRLYVPALLNSVTVETYQLFLAEKVSEILVDTEPGSQLLSLNSELVELTTEQRQLLHQHNFLATANQVGALSRLPQSERRVCMRKWIREASETYKKLPTPRLADEGSGFLDVWREFV